MMAKGVKKREAERKEKFRRILGMQFLLLSISMSCSIEGIIADQAGTRFLKCPSKKDKVPRLKSAQPD